MRSRCGGAPRSLLVPDDDPGEQDAAAAAGMEDHVLDIGASDKARAPPTSAGLVSLGLLTSQCGAAMAREQAVQVGSPGQWLRGQEAVRWAVVGILLLASGLKGHQLATEPVPDRDIFTYRWVLVVVVELELVLGLWLASGLHRRAAWLAALGCFACFVGVSLYKGIEGESSCGCFGVVEVSPWASLVLDLAILAALALTWRKVPLEPLPARYKTRLASGIAVALAAGVPLGMMMAIYRPSTLADDGTIIGQERFVLLEPEGWKGKRFPLRPHVEGGEQLSGGQWTVVLFRHDCPDCQRELPALQAQARQRTARDPAAKTMFVEVPPHAQPGKCPVRPDPAYVVSKLSSARDWFVTTPTMVELRDGTVVGAQEGRSAVQVAQYDPKVFAALASAAAQKPSRDVHNFGFVEPGSAHVAVFLVENPFDVPLAIRRAASECGCMAVAKPPAGIGPRSSATVQVNFVAPKEKVKYSKRALLLTSDPRRPAIPLRVEADVGMPLELRPPQIDLGRLIPGEHRRAEVRIANNGRQPLRPLYSTCATPGCVALIPRATVPPSGELAIAVDIRVPTTAAGPQATTVLIHTDSQSQPNVDLQVKYQALPGFTISQGSIDLGSLAPGEKRSATVEVTGSPGPAGQVVESCELQALSNVTGTVRVTAAGQKAAVQCSFEAGRNQGKVSGCVRLMIAGHDRPVEVDIVGRVTSEKVASAFAASQERNRP